MRHLRRLFIFAILASVAYKAYGFTLAADPAQTGVINCSGNAAAPTVVFTWDPNASRSYIVNASTTDIFIGFVAANSTATAAAFSISKSTGNFYVPATTAPYNTSTVPTPIIWSPDGPSDAFRGPMWCVANGGGADKIQRIRMH